MFRFLRPHYHCPLATCRFVHLELKVRLCANLGLVRGRDGDHRRTARPSSAASSSLRGQGVFGHCRARFTMNIQAPKAPLRSRRHSKQARRGIGGLTKPPSTDQHHRFTVHRLDRPDADRGSEPTARRGLDAICNQAIYLILTLTEQQGCKVCDTKSPAGEKRTDKTNKQAGRLFRGEINRSMRIICWELGMGICSRPQTELSSRSIDLP